MDIVFPKKSITHNGINQLEFDDPFKVLIDGVEVENVTRLSVCCGEQLEAEVIKNGYDIWEKIICSKCRLETDYYFEEVN